MRRLGRFILVVAAVEVIVGVTLASTATPDVPTPVHARRAVASAPQVTTPPTTTPAPPAPLDATASGNAAPKTHVAGRTVTRDPGPQWEHFGGQLTASSNEIATARGPGIGISVHPGEVPAAGLSNPTKLGAPRVLLVARDEGEWLQVLLPLRPNDSLGWIRRDDVDVSSVGYRVEIDRAAHRIHVFNGDAVIVDDPVAVGKASTPTPYGQFFTVELLQPPNPRGAYGPYAFTLSGYSDVYQTFGSGDGSVGLHGTDEPSSIGRDASHGCVRLHNETISYLASILPIGTPVFIR